MTNKKILTTMLQIVSQLKEDKNNIEKKYEKLMKEISNLPSIVKAHDSEIKNIKNSISSVNQEIQKIMSVIQEYNSSFTELENKVFNINKEVASYSSSIINTEKSNQDLKKMVTNLLYETKNLESKFSRNISIIENKLALLEAKTNINTTEGIKNDLKNLSISMKELKDIVKININNLEERISRLSNRFESYDLELELSEAINSLYRTSDINRILTNLKQIEDVIQKMKNINIWNKERNEDIITFLQDLADIWESYSNLDIADMIRSKIKEIKSPVNDLTTRK